MRVYHNPSEIMEFFLQKNLYGVSLRAYTDDEIYAWAGRMREYLPGKAHAYVGDLACVMINRANRGEQTLEDVEMILRDKDSLP